MKTINLMNPFTRFLNLVALMAATDQLSATLYAADTNSIQSLPLTEQREFATPELAVNALQTATQAGDTLALQEIFGPELQQLQTGDKVQDVSNARRFAEAMAQACHQIREAEDKITLEVGTNGWPLPIPLVKTNGQWHFDTAAGQEEIINRHIGKDELCAIGVCRVYVAAQHQFADAKSATDGVASYAQRFKSAPGMKDGLYWPVAGNEAASPFGPLVAEAQAEGYDLHQDVRSHPFHGYYFRILTRQGEAAPGGRADYMGHGSLTGGFALVAYPEHWEQSGIMTFIVNQDGKVYQQNLAGKTARLAGTMKEYNPDDNWTLVPDQGVLDAALEK